jgi:ABC-type Fe3+-siderophore transport system permease subunit
LAAVLFVVSVCSLFIGVMDADLASLMQGDPEVIRLFLISRIPRLLAILCTGIGMSTAGLIMQQLCMNKFVSPTTGATISSAQLGILLALVFLPESTLLGRAVFAFVAIKDTVNIPLIFQLLILELAIDGLRLAAMNTPSMLSTPLSVIAGIVMGEFSVRSGWFNSEVMLYMAFVAVANYTQPNFELGYALKFMRLLLLVLTAMFNWIGFLIGCVIVIVSIVCNKTLSGRSYLRISKN